MPFNPQACLISVHEGLRHSILQLRRLAYLLHEKEEKKRFCRLNLLRGAHPFLAGGAVVALMPHLLVSAQLLPTLFKRR